MRVAVVDIGSNSTRLLVADVGAGTLTELDRRSTVTRLGERLEQTGALGPEPQARVFRVLDEYADAIARLDAERSTAVMTSAVRDAANGAQFATRVREEYGLEARTLSGDEEARLSFLGATAARDPSDTSGLLVIDIGGGSTELVVGAAGAVSFHVSTQIGVVRHTERHIEHDPPLPEEVRALAADARAAIDASVPADVRESVRSAVGVAGTATSTAAIALELEPYDAGAVEGTHVSVVSLRQQLDRLAALPLERRRATRGLHPDRAPTIVAGVAILLEVLDSFALSGFEASERDILWGVALDLAP